MNYMDCNSRDHYLGIDFGTSGARAIVIDCHQTVQAVVTTPYVTKPGNAGLAAAWRSALYDLLDRLPDVLRQTTRAIAIDGTSGTALLCNQWGDCLTEPLLYNDTRSSVVLDQVATIAPPQHLVLSATSTLAKLLWWQSYHPHVFHQTTDHAPYLMHQADWLTYWLHGKMGITDYHNALKLGYDVASLQYPDWLTMQAWYQNKHLVLPTVVEPGTEIAPVQPSVCDRWQFPADCSVCAGTTDSIAAFLASGAQQPGEAVTSLGSTLAVKLLSTTRVDATQHGIYSHRLGDLWLVGGASNTGGAVLREFFTPAELRELSQQIDPTQNSGLDYYPLINPGERFPINDPHLQPQLEPRPDNPVKFLHGLLEGIARIEAWGYHLLQTLGATPLNRLYTAGGGADNPTWTAIRQNYLPVNFCQPLHTEAAYGVARLAMLGINPC
jgi:sugar (pentulose or hexulose) kinase